MAAEETNPAVQVNMFKFLSALHQDVCDYSFIAAKGALCLILCQIDENKVSWDNLPGIQALFISVDLRYSEPLLMLSKGKTQQ